jgi:hypothetical protein
MTQPPDPASATSESGAIWVLAHHRGFGFGLGFHVAALDVSRL